MRDYDYATPNWYFVTICTQNKISYFGKIVNEKVHYNKLGMIVKQQWLWLKHYSYVGLDEFIIMPNHFHGILIIDPLLMSENNVVEHVSVGDARERPVPLIKPKIKSLSELIGAFKTTSAKLIHNIGFYDFQWQRSFYDHVIRDEKSLYEIRQYMRNNPLDR